MFFRHHTSNYVAAIIIASPRERRLGSLSTSTAGTLRTDEPNAGKTGSGAVSTGESNVQCGV